MMLLVIAFLRMLRGCVFVCTEAIFSSDSDSSDENRSHKAKSEEVESEALRNSLCCRSQAVLIDN